MQSMPCESSINDFDIAWQQHLALFNAWSVEPGRLKQTCIKIASKVLIH